jgi:hypothetical protein
MRTDGHDIATRQMFATFHCEGTNTSCVFFWWCSLRHERFIPNSKTALGELWSDNHRFISRSIRSHSTPMSDESILRMVTWYRCGSGKGLTEVTTSASAWSDWDKAADVGWPKNMKRCATVAWIHVTHLGENTSFTGCYISTFLTCTTGGFTFQLLQTYDVRICCPVKPISRHH